MTEAIVAVSDVHLGYRDQQKQDAFLEFLHACERENFDHLVLCGDILDMWRRRNVDIFSCYEDVCRKPYTKKEPADRKPTSKKVTINGEILRKLGRMERPQIHYIVGNHDFALLSMCQNDTGEFPFPVTLSERIHDGTRWNTFLHGHQLDVLANMEGWGIDLYEEWSYRLCGLGDMTGGLTSSFWTLKETIEAKLNAQVRTMLKNPNLRDGVDRTHSFADSQGAYLYLGMPPGDRLIYGHTHDMDKPISQDVANTGCWGWENNKGQKNCYLTIIDGIVGRGFYDGGDILPGEPGSP